MIKKRKAQGALEFLMTYGWAFLVILIMIGALAYFGILNPSRFLPDRCQFSNPLLCKRDQFTVRDSDNGTIIARIINNFGSRVLIKFDSIITDYPGVCGEPTNLHVCMWDATNETLSCENCAGSECLNLSTGIHQEWAEGITKNIIIDCYDGGIYNNADSKGGSSLSVGDKVKFIVKMKWYPKASTATFEKMAEGEIYASVQEAS